MPGRCGSGTRAAGRGGETHRPTLFSVSEFQLTMRNPTARGLTRAEFFCARGVSGKLLALRWLVGDAESPNLAARKREALGWANERMAWVGSLGSGGGLPVAPARTSDVRGVRPSLRSRDQASPRRPAPRFQDVACAKACYGVVAPPRWDIASGARPSRVRASASSGSRLSSQMFSLWTLRKSSNSARARSRSPRRA